MFFPGMKINLFELDWSEKIYDDNFILLLTVLLGKSFDYTDPSQIFLSKSAENCHDDDVTKFR